MDEESYNLAPSTYNLTSTRPSVLVVEDDRWLADMYRDVLEHEFQVTIRYDAQSAAEALDLAKPSVILLDMMLPGGNGLAFLQELRSYEDMKNMPVLVCSGAAELHRQRRALQNFAPLALLDKAVLTPERLHAAMKQAYGAAQ